MTESGSSTITKAFFDKFRSDKRKFGEKLKSIGIARATYSDLRFNRRDPKKKTVEAIRAYLENRKAKYDLVDPKVEFYCCDCEQIKIIEVQKDRWTCRPCANLIRLRSRKRRWSSYLQKRRKYKLKKKYGNFDKCMRLIIDIKKEIRVNEKTNSVRRVVTKRTVERPTAR